MRVPSVIGALLIGAGLSGIGVAGMMGFFKPSHAFVVSFVDPSQLQKLEFGRENNLEMRVANLRSDAMRIIGTDAC